MPDYTLKAPDGTILTVPYQGQPPNPADQQAILAHYKANHMAPPPQIDPLRVFQDKAAAARARYGQEVDAAKVQRLQEMTLPADERYGHYQNAIHFADQKRQEAVRIADQQRLLAMHAYTDNLERRILARNNWSVKSSKGRVFSYYHVER